MLNSDSPEMVAWEALREHQYSPREAARSGDIVVSALRKAGLINVGGSPGAEGLRAADPAGRQQQLRPPAIDPETHPSSSDPISNFVAPLHEGRALLGAPKPLSPEEWAVVDEFEKAFTPLEQAMRDIADAGEWPEVGI